MCFLIMSTFLLRILLQTLKMVSFTQMNVSEKQWYFLPKTKMSQTKMSQTKISQTKHKIWSANRISEESQSGTTEGFVKLYVVRQ